MLNRLIAFSGAALLAATASSAPARQDNDDAPSVGEVAPTPPVLNFTMKDIDGKEINLARYKGKVILMVNTASKCGYTPQYEGLEKLYETYHRKGLVILGFPANNFRSQEPGTDEEIKTFCTTQYDVRFQMFSKVSVKGDDICPLYKLLTDPKKILASEGEIQWNFEKFLIDPDGKVVKHVRSKTTPEMLTEDIEKLLARLPAQEEKQERDDGDEDDDRGLAAFIVEPVLSDAAAVSLPGLPNVVAYHKDCFSGGAPEGDEGFQTLAEMGVKTIISVDGAAPDVDMARAHGLRYIHLPIGYNGFDEQRKLELVRAARDAMGSGPVYIHCHHGKHRSAGAAAAIAVSLGWMTPDQAVARMHVSGTAAEYKGLYACAADATVISPAVIDAVRSDFPEVSRPQGFVKAMVEIDEIANHLKAIEKANWSVPADHPDLVPVAEAGRMADLFRFLAEGDRAQKEGGEFTTHLTNMQDMMQSLEDMLAAGGSDLGKLSAQFKQINASCSACHIKYRD